MNCKICGGPFTDFKYFHPSTLAPLPVDTALCGRRFLIWQDQKYRMRKQKRRARQEKLREMPARPIEVSIVI
jgi:hypothetical protein